MGKVTVQWRFERGQLGQYLGENVPDKSTNSWSKGTVVGTVIPGTAWR